MIGGYPGCHFFAAGAVGVALEVCLLDALDGVLPRARYLANGTRHVGYRELDIFNFCIQVELNTRSLQVFNHGQNH